MTTHAHIIKRQRVALGGSATPSAPSAPGATGRPSAKKNAEARLLTHDGVVRGVEITCACGEVTVVELTYDAAQARSNTKG